MIQQKVLKEDYKNISINITSGEVIVKRRLRNPTGRIVGVLCIVLSELLPIEILPKYVAVIALLA